MLPVKAFHLVIGGAFQEEGEHTGSFSLYLRLRQLSSPTCSVCFREFHADWNDVANGITASSFGGSDRPLINIYAYSWGAGRGAMTLARRLAERGLRVDQMVLCDPVYHSRWFPLAAFFHCKNWPQIVVPANVNRVSWFRQFRDHPRGHNLVASLHSKTVIDSPQVCVGVLHLHMDEQKDYHNESLRAAGIQR